MALRKLVAGNWKMNGLSSDLAEIKAIADGAKAYPGADVALCVPAILIELGFLSNPAEEARLKDSAYRDRIVEALARAVQGFRQRVAALQ